MKRAEAVNTFEKGMVMDFNPLVQPAGTMTSCLNGTILTNNGNENVLQNDMGNGRVETAFLPEGYVPLGTAELGGIIYILSYNPFTKYCQVGSFPSPEQIFYNDKLANITAIFSDGDFIESSKDPFYTVYYKKEEDKEDPDSFGVKHREKTELVRKSFEETLMPGDKFKLFASNLLDNCNRLEGIKGCENNIPLIKFSLGILQENGSLVNIDSDKLKDYLIGDGITYNIADNPPESDDINDPKYFNDYRSAVSTDFNILNLNSSGTLQIIGELQTINNLKNNLILKKALKENAYWKFTLQFNPIYNSNLKIIWAITFNDTGYYQIIDENPFEGRTSQDILNYKLIPIIEINEDEYIELSQHIITGTFNLREFGTDNVYLEEYRYLVINDEASINFSVNNYLNPDYTINSFSINFSNEIKENYNYENKLFQDVENPILPETIKISQFTSGNSFRTFNLSDYNLNYDDIYTLTFQIKYTDLEGNEHYKQCNRVFYSSDLFNNKYLNTSDFSQLYLKDSNLTTKINPIKKYYKKTLEQNTDNLPRYYQPNLEETEQSIQITNCFNINFDYDIQVESNHKCIPLTFENISSFDIEGDFIDKDSLQVLQYNESETVDSDNTLEEPEIINYPNNKPLKVLGTQIGQVSGVVTPPDLIPPSFEIDDPDIEDNRETKTISEPITFKNQYIGILENGHILESEISDNKAILNQGTKSILIVETEDSEKLYCAYNKVYTANQFDCVCYKQITNNGKTYYEQYDNNYFVKTIEDLVFEAKTTSEINFINNSVKYTNLIKNEFGEWVPVELDSTNTVYTIEYEINSIFEESEEPTGGIKIEGQNIKGYIHQDVITSMLCSYYDTLKDIKPTNYLTPLEYAKRPPILALFEDKNTGVTISLQNTPAHDPDKSVINDYTTNQLVRFQKFDEWGVMYDQLIDKYGDVDIIPLAFTVGDFFWDGTGEKPANQTFGLFRYSKQDQDSFFPNLRGINYWADSNPLKLDKYSDDRSDHRVENIVYHYKFSIVSFCPEKSESKQDQKGRLYMIPLFLIRTYKNDWVPFCPIAPICPNDIFKYKYKNESTWDEFKENNIWNLKQYLKLVDNEKNLTFKAYQLNSNTFYDLFKTYLNLNISVTNIRLNWNLENLPKNLQWSAEDRLKISDEKSLNLISEINTIDDSKISFRIFNNINITGLNTDEHSCINQFLEGYNMLYVKNSETELYETVNVINAYKNNGQGNDANIVNNKHIPYTYTIQDGHLIFTNDFSDYPATDAVFFSDDDGFLLTIICHALYDIQWIK